ncbi:MAG: DUF3617 family protein [Caulobacteraceae bacterium]
MKRVVLVAAAAALALAGCSKKADTAAGGATGAAASATAPEAAKPAVAVSAPTRKPGLWEQTMHMGQMTQTTKMCLDETTEQKMKWWATENRGEKGENPCTEQAVTQKLGGGWTFHSVCKMGDSGTITSNGEASGDFGSHYTVKITSVTTGSAMPQANGTHEMTMEGTWKGACPAGMKGGDIQLANGMTFNASDGPAMAGRGAGGRMTPADIAKLRAQAREMAKAAHQAQ